MPIEPKIPKPTSNQFKTCQMCGRSLNQIEFAVSHSIFFPDGHLPVCNYCITKYLKEKDFKWDEIDKICQCANIPFIVKEWTRLLEMNDEDHIWAVYSNVFAGAEYENLGWGDYDKQYRKLQEVSLIEEEIPDVREAKYESLRRKWGANYADEDLNYLEDLYHGLLTTQNVNGALQIDQAQKLCKLSFEIDSRIRAGDKDVDKFIASYDKLIKVAEFTPKNTKNAADFDSFAELALWLEKRGKQNKFYDGTSRDIIDETIKNIQNYNQKLYINEGGIGEDISERIDKLNISQEQENIYGVKEEYDLDEYDNAGYLLGETEDFKIDLEDDNDARIN